MPFKDELAWSIPGRSKDPLEKEQSGENKLKDSVIPCTHLKSEKLQ